LFRILERRKTMWKKWARAAMTLVAITFTVGVVVSIVRAGGSSTVNLSDRDAARVLGLYKDLQVAQLKFATAASAYSETYGEEVTKTMLSSIHAPTGAAPVPVEPPPAMVTIKLPAWHWYYYPMPWKWTWFGSKYAA
jgi:hypothetical protein